MWFIDSSEQRQLILIKTNKTHVFFLGVSIVQLTFSLWYIMHVDS